jgi:uncharacterized protein (DUF952 family)
LIGEISTLNFATFANLCNRKNIMKTILHIISQTEWTSAQESDKYEAPSLHSEGFIHFSTADQVLRVANAFYRGHDDLLLLVVDPDKLNAELRWEDPVHPGVHMDTAQSEVFPHLYGPLNFDAVVNIVPMPASSDGAFQLPDGLSG